MIEFYSPKPENKGAALFVTVRPEEQSVVLGLVKQTGYDDSTKKGSFKGGKRINVNLSLDEVGSIINTVKTNGKFPIYHTFDGKPTATGNFGYYSLGDGPVKKTGFGLSLKKDDVDFRIGFTHGSAEKLVSYLQFALVKCFEVDWAADDKKEREWQEAKKNKPAPAPVQKQPEENNNQPTESSPDSGLDW